MKKGFRQERKPTNKQIRKAEQIQSFIEGYTKLCTEHMLEIKGQFKLVGTDKQIAEVTLAVVPFTPEAIQETVAGMKIELENELANGTIVRDTEEHKARLKAIEDKREELVDKFLEDIIKYEAGVAIRETDTEKPEEVTE